MPKKNYVENICCRLGGSNLIFCLFVRKADRANQVELKLSIRKS